MSEQPVIGTNQGTSSGGAPSGAAGGDLAGTYPGPTIKSGVGLTGVPTAPTAAPGTNTTQLATTAYADAIAALKANLASPTFTGTPAAPTAAVDTNTTQLATTAYVVGQAYAKLASPTFTGSPVLPTGATVVTQTENDNSTKPASTAYVDRLRPNYYMNGSNANVAETIPRWPVPQWSQTIALGATGVMQSYAIPLVAGMVITSLTFRSGTTAAGTPTHWWYALYDTQATPALIAQTADQTSTAFAANTSITVALGSPAPYTVTTSGIHYVSIMFTATTVPTGTGLAGIAGLNAANGGVTGQKRLTTTSGSALTTTAPGTIASPTDVGGVSYMATS